MDDFFTRVCNTFGNLCKWKACIHVDDYTKIVAGASCEATIDAVHDHMTDALGQANGPSAMETDTADEQADPAPHCNPPLPPRTSSRLVSRQGG